MTSAETLALFDDTGAYLKGHFRLTSGLHSPEYLQCALVLQWPERASQLGAALAARLREVAGPFDAVISPAIGALVIGHEVARHLGVRFLFAERDATGQMTLRRGFSIPAGERLAVVEDVITTGGSTFEVMKLVEASGAITAAAGSVIDRSGGTVDLGVPRVALATLEVLTFAPDHCPLCAEGVPVTKPGSRAA